MVHIPKVIKIKYCSLKMMKVLSIHALFLDPVKIIMSETHKNVSELRNRRTAKTKIKWFKDSYLSHECEYNHGSFPS